MTSEASTATRPTRPEDKWLGVPRSFLYGLQHILTMFGGVIAVPLIIGGAAGLEPLDRALLVACCLFVSGAATILQTLGLPFLGAQLPLVQGVSFAAVSTMLAIVADRGEEGLRSVYGAVIVAGAIGIVITPLFSRVIRFFPPVVTGSIITVIGLSLMPVAAGWITGQPQITVDGELQENPLYRDPTSIVLACVTLAAILVLSKIRATARVAILLGLVIGTVVAAFLGRVSTGTLGQAAIVAAPQPFAFGAPIFEIGAIVSMTIVILVIMVETTADILAVGEVVGTRIDPKRVSAGLRADMLSTTIAPIFNAFPATAFAQNVGLVALTGIRSRFPVAFGGGVLVLLGLSPFLAAVIGMLPQPVLGGAGIVLFGTVAASGIRTLSQVQYRENNNLVIVAASIAFGLIPVVARGFWEHFPAWFATIFDSGISSTAIMAVVLNLFFNVLTPGRPRGGATDFAGGPPVLVTTTEMRVLAQGGTFEAGQEVAVVTPEPKGHAHA